VVRIRDWRTALLHQSIGEHLASLGGFIEMRVT
jgi:hypothetical protein